MTDVTHAAQAGYRGDLPAPAYLSSPNGCAYVAGMAHRLRGGLFPARASMGRGYKVNVGSKSYDSNGPECADARLVLTGSRWANSQ